jgi:P63C domain
VYARLAPGIIEELERKNPSENGRRQAKHHQWLTEDVGHPALAQHLHAVITLMKTSTSWNQFKVFLDQAHPKR